MKVNGIHRRSIFVAEDGWSVEIIDQRRLPHAFAPLRLTTMEACAEAIRSMAVRGAPLIGMVAAYGLCLALRENATQATLDQAYATLLATRPTAVNLRWALEQMRAALAPLPPSAWMEAAYAKAQALCDQDAALCESIGTHGLEVLKQHAAAKRSQPLNILTHCNAGWLATVDWGTALAPIYMAHDAGIPVHVWVDETRPRNQGALTAWELGSHGVPHTLIVDNAGGHLMQHGQVDLCIVGTDRVLANGDVCNKIGTYLKALAAKDNGVPFYVALPMSTLDTETTDSRSIEIEERAGAEITALAGRNAQSGLETIHPLPEGVKVANPAFDVTPARLVTAFITESGVFAPQSPAFAEYAKGRAAQTA